MTDKNKVSVRIAGKDYTLVGVEAEEYIQKIALYIDKKLNTIIRLNSKLSTSMASVLTAINVADDFFKARETAELLDMELKDAKKEIEKLKKENTNLANENAVLENKNTNFQLQLAKREAELNEVRNSLNNRNS
ncbi:UNVERIFIED_CONTAM: cell division protein ZapA [Acetivibrio alkalicellulosi]